MPSSPKKFFLVGFGVAAIVIAWSPWLTAQKARSIVRTYPSFQAAHPSISDAQIGHMWFPFCRWISTYERGWWVCFWQHSEHASVVREAASRSIVSTADFPKREFLPIGASNTPESFMECSPKKIVREAAPHWMTVNVDGYAVTIPYSHQWQADGGSCMTHNVYASGMFSYVVGVNTSSGSESTALSFGRPADNLTDIGPEYRLYRQPASPFFLHVLPDEYSCGNSDVVTPLEMEIGGIKGWRFFMGGAKWCVRAFQFKKGNDVYTLERNLEPSFYAAVKEGKTKQEIDALFSEIDPEMRTIIQSIK